MAWGWDLGFVKVFKILFRISQTRGPRLDKLKTFKKSGPIVYYLKIKLYFYSVTKTKAHVSTNLD